MARKEVDVTITADGRDKGKTFRLTEMSASQAERWASRAFRALAKSNTEVPTDVENAGIAELAVFGFKALSGVDDATFDSLMDDIMKCVTVKETALVRALTEDDIEEISTRLKLKMEVFQLITGFSLAGLTSKLGSTPAVAIS